MKKSIGFIVLVLLLGACSTRLPPLEPKAVFVIAAPVSSTLPQGNVGTLYGVALSTTGGNLPVTWSIVSGRLPSGLSIRRNVGVSSTRIEGTPTQVQNTTFTVQARDKRGNTARRTFTLSIAAPAPLVITNQSSVLLTGTLGVSYATNLFASGGVKPYSWAITAGQLPNGLGLSGNQISGTPVVVGIFIFTARVTDAQGTQTSQEFSITINP